MEHRLHNVVYARLEAIAQAEKITRTELGHLSRELLIYTMDTQDIDIVNRLIGVLTPVNRKVAILYFQHFLPWVTEQDKDGTFNRFGKKMQGDKKIIKRQDAITAWLLDEANNIWTWADDNVEVKQKDFKATIARAIKKALEGDDKSGTAPLSRDDIMAAIFDGGISIDDMLYGIDAHEKAVAAAVAEQERVAA